MSYDTNEEFLINGHTVEIDYKDISSEGMGAIREQIRKDDLFGAEVRAVVAGIESLKFDDKTIIRKRNRAERRANASSADAEAIPNEYDKKSEEFLWDILIKGVVKRNEWMALRPPFKDVFAQYAEDDAEEKPKKDPTPLRAATSGEG